MKTLIGIERRKAEKSVIKLNILLADYEIFYDNLKGAELFELREKFEVFYDDIFDKIDQIAERILTVECEPLSTYANYLAIIKSKSKIKSNEEAQVLALA